MNTTQSLNQHSVLAAADQQQLDTFYAAVQESAEHFLGYPIAQDFNYESLYPLLKYPLNNVGDPLVESSYGLNSRSIELEVLQFFAKHFRAPAENWWGYVTNGGTEGNLYGLYLARELYPKGMVYYSEATHYSVQKNIQLLNMPSIVIKAQANGEIDYEDLRTTLSLNRATPAIIFTNIGTTMTEAIDDLKQIKQLLSDLAIKNHYIHCDCALVGGYAPFISPKPTFDFVDGADSLSMSGHKFVGSPIPCGIVLAKKAYRDRVGRMVAYVDTLDTTITGSRNGHSPLFLWYAIKQLGSEGLALRYQNSLALANQTLTSMHERGIKAWKNPASLTVVFEAPSKALTLKWQLATDSGWSHVICMPGVRPDRIEALLSDLELDKQMREQDELCLV